MGRRGQCHRAYHWRYAAHVRRLRGLARVRGATPGRRGKPAHPNQARRAGLRVRGGKWPRRHCWNAAPSGSGRPGRDAGDQRAARGRCRAPQSQTSHGASQEARTGIHSAHRGGAAARQRGEGELLFVVPGPTRDAFCWLLRPVGHCDRSRHRSRAHTGKVGRAGALARPWARSPSSCPKHASSEQLLRAVAPRSSAPPCHQCALAAHALCSRDCQ
mmetsp:Transcript_13405/g.42737  ORF Transcript_13405/g.42737 Transcript_13405/m.42737 type:complete len:216 (+) Transcript_13405:330-977(+)